MGFILSRLLPSRPSPLHILEDSGIPPGSTDYTTVVIVHGYAYHSGIFRKLVPLGNAYNARIILVNRRDYPGSAPLTDAERALLPSPPLEPTANTNAIAAAKENVQKFMKDQAQQLYELLEGLVNSGKVPVADREKHKGGIVVAGWSMGTVWMTALLAHAGSFSSKGFDMADYMLRVVFLDAPHRNMGYPTPETGVYNPLFDMDLAPEERTDVFADWASGYYGHGPTRDTLAVKTYLPEPPPTLSTLTAEEVAGVLSLPPGEPGGSDALLLDAGIELGLWTALRKAALALPQDEGDGRGAWRNVEVRNVTCGRSVCDTLYSMFCLKEELEEAKAKGEPMRDVRFVMINGANHFVQWDQPELALRALVGNEEVVE